MNEQAPPSGSGNTEGGLDETAPIASAPGGPGPAAAPPPPPPASSAEPSTSTLPAGAPPPPPGTTTGVLDPPPPPPPAAAVPAGPARPGLLGALTTIGVGLLAAAVVISTERSRADGDLDWSNYVVGLGATAVLVLVTLVATVVVRRRHEPVARGELVTWPGVVGIFAITAMLGVGIGDQDWISEKFAYVEGAVITVLAVLGYVASRRAAYVVTALAGLAILYIKGFDDLFGDSLDKDSTVITIAIAITVFVAGLTVVGWVLPTRATSGVVLAVAGVVSFSVLLIGMAATKAFAGMFSTMMFSVAGDDSGVGALGGGSAPPTFDFDNDTWVVLVLAAGLTVLWALAAAWTGNSGFTIAAILMPAIDVPLAMVVLAVEHPTWWGVVVAAAGAVLLVAGALLGRSRARHAAAPEVGGF